MPPAGIVWDIRLRFLAECAGKYPHLNYAEKIMTIAEFLVENGFCWNRYDILHFCNIQFVKVNSDRTNPRYELVSGDKVKVFNNRKECLLEKIIN